VAQTAADGDISHKKLIRLFSEQIGYTPKLYLRVLRFQRLLDKVWDAHEVDWAPMAAAHGYCDQPHLIRDFREFSGFTPSEYLRHRGPFQQHVPLPA
jgi:transcriptional regulator GlxA family with amidase domain